MNIKQILKVIETNHDAGKPLLNGLYYNGQEMSGTTINFLDSGRIDDKPFQMFSKEWLEHNKHLSEQDIRELELMVTVRIVPKSPPPPVIGSPIMPMAPKWPPYVHWMNDSLSLWPDSNYKFTESQFREIKSSAVRVALVELLNENVSKSVPLSNIPPRLIGKGLSPIPVDLINDVLNKLRQSL